MSPINQSNNKPSPGTAEENVLLGLGSGGNVVKGRHVMHDTRKKKWREGERTWNGHEKWKIHREEEDNEVEKERNF